MARAGMITLEEAWEQLIALARPVGGETVPVDDAVGRVLTEDLAARRTQPYADLSAMDGFAVSGPGPWTIVGEARAGHAFTRRIAPGEAVVISTGAACPEGTDGIVIRENAQRDHDSLSASAPDPGEHIRRRGFDFAAGDRLLTRGTAIGPAQLALVRAAGHGELVVARRPKVAVLECGDELAADPANCPPDALPASNGAMVAAMVRGVGATARQIGPLPDRRDALADAIVGAADSDVIVTTAGASVGDHDHVRGALEDAGAQLAFWRVAIRPGKPLLVARLGDRVVLGLPGNPSSAFVTAWLFLLPFLRALQGVSDPRPAPVSITLGDGLPAGGQRREFLRGVWDGSRVHPLSERDSSALRTLARATVLIDRPIDGPELGKGDLASCYWIGTGANA